LRIPEGAEVTVTANEDQLHRSTMWLGNSGLDGETGRPFLILQVPVCEPVMGMTSEIGPLDTTEWQSIPSRSGSPMRALGESAHGIDSLGAYEAKHFLQKEAS
jgi:hypothetical protein